MAAGGIALLLSVALFAAACTADRDVESADESESPTSTEADNTSSSSIRSDDEQGQDESDNGAGSSLPDGALTEEEARKVLAELDGQLALGNGPTVAVVRPDGLAYIELDGSRSSVASQPTWSRAGGRLAWSTASAQARGARFQVFDEEGVADGEPVTSLIPGSPVFYFQWSEADDEVLYLRDSSRGPLLVEAGVVAPEESGTRIADGRPFFVSWNPDQRFFAGHVGEQRVALFDPDDGAPLIPDDDDEEPSDPTANDVPGRDVAKGGGYSAPAWLDGDRLLVVDSGSLSALNVSTGQRQQFLAVDEPTRFVLSPDRSRVALVTSYGQAVDEPIEAALPTQQAEGPGELVVLDLGSGQTTVVTDRPALAWEWSPDGSKLAWLEAGGLSLSRGEARWRFWAPSGPVEGDMTSPVVRLSVKEAVNYLPFFAQYAQSVTRWAPDSSAFAIAGSIRNRQGIWVHLVDQLAEPVLIAPGDFATWGSGPTPPPTGGQSPA
jgi:TolB protein